MRLREAALIGTGCIGGSLLLALRREGLVDESRGYDPDPETAARAVRLGIVDFVFSSAKETVAGASLVVLATPVGALVEAARAIAGGLAPGALVIDVGSVKGELAFAVDAALGDGARFVGCHPLTEALDFSPRVGVDAADADLFRDRPCFLTRAARTDPAAIAEAAALWEAVGARPEIIDPDALDALMAFASHLPCVASLALALARDAAVDDRIPATVARLGIGAFGELPGRAIADAGAWSEALVANRATLRPLIARLAGEVAALGEAIARSDRQAVTDWIGDWIERAGRGRSRLRGE